MSPCVTTSLNLGMPQPSKGKPRRRWPWPLTCDLCHPHTSNPAPSLCTGWLRMACSLPGVSYYTLTHTDGPNLWRLRHVCAHCGSWLTLSVWICWNYTFYNLDLFFCVSVCLLSFSKFFNSSSIFWFTFVHLFTLHGNKYTLHGIEPHWNNMGKIKLRRRGGGVDKWKKITKY